MRARPALLGLTGWAAVLSSSAPPLPLWASLPLAALGCAAVAWQTARPNVHERNGR